MNIWQRLTAAGFLLWLIVVWQLVPHEGVVDQHGVYHPDFARQFAGTLIGLCVSAALIVLLAPPRPSASP